MRENGFALIDVVVAAAILLLIAGVSMATVIASLGTSKTVAFETVAQQLAQGELENLRQAPPTLLPIIGGSCSLQQTGYNCSYDADTTTPGTPSGVEHVKISVNPPSGNAYVLESYILP